MRKFKRNKRKEETNQLLFLFLNLQNFKFTMNAREGFWWNSHLSLHLRELFLLVTVNVFICMILEMCMVLHPKKLHTFMGFLFLATHPE